MQSKLLARDVNITPVEWLGKTSDSKEKQGRERRIFVNVADDFCSEAVREILGCLAVRRVGFVSAEARGTS